MTTQELIDYYVSLLIVQYAALPNAQATVAAFVRQAVANQIVTQVRDGFNFPVGNGLEADTASGVQLEAIAGYRGASRTVYGLDSSKRYFRMPHYDDTDADSAPGFALYGQPSANWYFLRYFDAYQPIYRLTDDELCRLTQLRAATQSTLLSVQNVDGILVRFFGPNVSVFETSMALLYVELDTDPSRLFSIANATRSLPRPSGVSLSVIRAASTTKFFGLRRYGAIINPTFVGFGLYGSPQAGSFVRYP